MKTKINLVFTKSNKPFPLISWIIRLCTGKDYSHVAREVERKNWGKGYYQASGSVVNYEHENIFNCKHKIVRRYTLYVDYTLDMEIRKACWQDCGKKYGILQNLGILLVDLGIVKDNPWKQGRNCSELIYIKVLKRIIPQLNYNPDTIKPGHVEDIILEYFYEKDGVWYLHEY